MQISVSIQKGGLQKFIKEINEIKNDIGDMSVKLSEMIAKAFVARARKRLMAFTGQKRYSYYIKAFKEENGHWAVRLNQPKYDEDIMYFLEYGTGFVGKESEQNPDKPSDWEYTINRDKYWYATLEIDGDIKQGWYFNYQEPHFLQEDDVNMEEYHDVRVIEKNDDGQRKDPSPLPTYFTSGIKPVMYIYKTKVEIQNLLNEVKGKKLKISYKQLKSRLNKLISGDIT